MDAHPMPAPIDPPTAIADEPRGRRPSHRRRGAAAAVGLAAVLTLGACGGRTSVTVTTPTAPASASIDQEVAQELRDVDAVLDELDATLAADLAED